MLSIVGTIGIPTQLIKFNADSDLLQAESICRLVANANQAVCYFSFIGSDYQGSVQPDPEPVPAAEKKPWEIRPDGSIFIPEDVTWTKEFCDQFNQEAKRLGIKITLTWDQTSNDQGGDAWITQSSVFSIDHEDNGKTIRPSPGTNAIGQDDAERAWDAAVESHLTNGTPHPLDAPFLPPGLHDVVSPDGFIDQNHVVSPELEQRIRNGIGTRSEPLVTSSPEKSVYGVSPIQDLYQAYKELLKGIPIPSRVDFHLPHEGAAYPEGKIIYISSGEAARAWAKQILDANINPLIIYHVSNPGNDELSAFCRDMLKPPMSSEERAQIKAEWQQYCNERVNPWSPKNATPVTSTTESPASTESVGGEPPSSPATPINETVSPSDATIPS